MKRTIYFLPLLLLTAPLAAQEEYPKPHSSDTLSVQSCKAEAVRLALPALKGEDHPGHHMHTMMEQAEALEKKHSLTHAKVREAIGCMIRLHPLTIWTIRPSGAMVESLILQKAGGEPGLWGMYLPDEEQKKADAEMAAEADKKAAEAAKKEAAKKEAPPKPDSAQMKPKPKG